MNNVINVDFSKKKKKSNGMLVNKSVIGIEKNHNSFNGKNTEINTECFGYKWLNITPTGFFAIVEQNDLPFPFPPDPDNFPRYA